MTLPTTTTLNASDDDSDIFGPPRTSPLRHTRPKVSMISPKLRLREERKRILQLCAHKLERIKDSETNLRRSVCINNTYSRLTDEVLQEKQSRYLANMPKSDSTNSLRYENNNFFRNESYRELTPPPQLLSQSNSYQHQHQQSITTSTSLPILSPASLASSSSTTITTTSSTTTTSTISLSSSSSTQQTATTTTTTSTALTQQQQQPHRRSSYCVDTDLETLDRELNALDASMPLLDPEIMQGAEQLEKAISRKRSRSEEDNDRLVREALAQFYLPSPRLLSGIDDCPLLPEKRCKIDLDFDLSSLDHHHHHHHHQHQHHHHHHHNQKEFEVIMDALRLGTTTTTTTTASDSCGQAAMISESGVFHNLVVASLET